MNENTFNKYYGERKYKERAQTLIKKDFSDREKAEMLKDCQRIIIENNFKLFHDFMDYICDNNDDYFNMLVFDKKRGQFIITYIKSRVRANLNKKVIR